MRERVQFLRSFLGALGAHRITVSAEDDDKVTGTVIYDATDILERQDFSWQAAETDVPDHAVRALVELLRDQRLLSIDKISITRDELRQRYNDRYGTNLDAQPFHDIIERLMAVRVSMVDDGEETDEFFIHE